MKPENLTHAQWQTALVIASSVCDPIRRAGGTPADALNAFGLSDVGLTSKVWSKVHYLIATAVYRQPECAVTRASPPAQQKLVRSAAHADFKGE